MALNAWTVFILRYDTGLLKWNKNELPEMDRKTRKFMTMNKELHPRSDIARLYVSRKNGGRGLIGCEYSVKSEENGLGWYIKNNVEPLLVAVRTSRAITHEETVDPKEFKKTKERQRKNEWTAKRMPGQFTGDMEDKDKNTCRWMRKSNLKGCTEALICSAQEQSIQTNYNKYNIDKTAESPLCRMCGTRNETISNIVSECGRLAQKEYKRRHDKEHVCDKEREKIEKYSLLKDEIARLLQMKKVVVIPIVVGALGTTATKFEKYIESFGIEIRIKHVQKSALLGTARIIRKVLSC